MPGPSAAIPQRALSHCAAPAIRSACIPPEHGIHCAREGIMPCHTALSGSLRCQRPGTATATSLVRQYLSFVIKPLVDEGREARGREAHAYPRNTCATPSATSAKVSRPRNVHAGLSATARENRCQLPVFRTGRNGNGEAAKAARSGFVDFVPRPSTPHSARSRMLPRTRTLEPHLAVALPLTASGRCDMLRITTVMRNSKAPFHFLAAEG